VCSGVVSRVELASDATTLEDAAALTLAAPTPHAVLDALFQGIFQTLGRNWAIRADLASAVDTNSIAGEEHRRRVVAAVAFGHPGSDGVYLGGVVDTVHRVSFVDRDASQSSGAPDQAQSDSGRRNTSLAVYRRLAK
jgi:hypothetical protein